MILQGVLVDGPRDYAVPSSRYSVIPLQLGVKFQGIEE